MPYRTEALRRVVPLKYRIWENPRLRSFLVRMRFSSQRWGFRFESFAEMDRDFESIHEACKRLEFERSLTRGHCDAYIVDRKTGKCFSPPPRILDDLVAQRCLVCKAGPEERCDAGLHS